MAEPDNTLLTPNVRQAHLGIEESGYGAGGTQDATTAALILDDTSVARQKNTRLESKERGPDRDMADSDNGRKEAGALTINAYYRSSNAEGAASPAENLFRAALGPTVRTTPAGLTVAAAPASSTTTVYVGADHGLQLFDPIIVDDLYSIVGRVGADHVDLLIPLAAIPAVGSSLAVCRVIHPDPIQPTFWYDEKQDSEVLTHTGCVAESLAISSSGSEQVMVALTGQFGNQTISGETALRVAVADAIQTLWDVYDPAAFEVGAKFDCEGETGIVVDAVDMANRQITVTRGAGAAAHALDVLITPAWVGVSSAGAGEKAIGTTGLFVVKDRYGAATPVAFTNVSVTFPTGGKLINDESKSTSPTGSVSGARPRATVTGTIHKRRKDLFWLRDAQDRLRTPLLLYFPVGDRCVGAIIPRAEILIPEDASGDDMYDLNLSFEVQRAQDLDGVDVSDRTVAVFTW